MAAPNKVKTETKKKVKKNVPVGNAYILASFNNTICTFTDPQGGVIAWSSAGAVGFKGSRKGTPFAAQIAAENAGKKAMESGMRNINVYVTGPGAGRESSMRVFGTLGLKIGMIKDTTPVPHNGCRPAKRRRV
jgi:small subunit ribosomal protein S11